MKKKKVLLIDDDDVFRYIVKRIIELKAPNVELIPANSCKAALEVLDRVENGYVEYCPDIVLLDLDMPVMNGFEFMDTYEAKLKRLNPNLRVYIVSTTLSTEEKERARSYDSVTDFIGKPIDPEKMEEVFNL